MQQQQSLAADTLLGIMAHSSLAVGLVTLSFMPSVRVDLMGYLFGDLLAVSFNEVLLIVLGSILVLGLLGYFWRNLLALTVDEELAKVEGLPVTQLRLVLMLLIAVVIAVAMKVVGVLLITSLLIIPAATAQKLARSPEQMALMASVIGVFSVLGGLSMSWHLDTPAGPSIVVCAALCFVLSLLIRLRR